MNAARKALIKIQTAPPGVPVGRFQPQVAIIADFFDSLVNLKIENNALHRQLLEAHERFGKMMGDTEVPPAAKVDQAAFAKSFVGMDFATPGADKTVASKIKILETTLNADGSISAKARFTPEDIEQIKNLDINDMYRDDLFFNPNHTYGKFGRAAPAGPTFEGKTTKEIFEGINRTVRDLIDIKKVEYAKINEGAPVGYEIATYKYSPFTAGQKFAYKDYIAAGWTDNQLIENGLLVKVQPNA